MPEAALGGPSGAACTRRPSESEPAQPGDGPPTTLYAAPDRPCPSRTSVDGSSPWTTPETSPCSRTSLSLNGCARSTRTRSSSRPTHSWGSAPPSKSARLPADQSSSPFELGASAESLVPRQCRPGSAADIGPNVSVSPRVPSQWAYEAPRAAPSGPRPIRTPTEPTTRSRPVWTGVGNFKVFPGWRTQRPFRWVQTPPSISLHRMILPALSPAPIPTGGPLESVHRPQGLPAPRHQTRH